MLNVCTLTSNFMLFVFKLSLHEVYFVFPKTFINDNVCSFFQSRSLREKINNNNECYNATMEERTRMHETQEEIKQTKNPLTF